MNNFKFVILSLLSFSTSSQTISIVTEHLSPFQIVKENNEITGFSTDIIIAALNRTPHKYTLEANPWDISYNQALKDSSTCIYSLAFTPERESKFQWSSEVIINRTISYYSLRSKNIELSHIKEVEKYKVAVIKNDVTHHYMLTKGFKENKNLYVMENYDALIYMLEKRKNNIDLILLNDELLKNRVSNKEQRSRYKKTLLIDEFKLLFYFACNINAPKQVIADFSQALREIKLDGTYQIIVEKWQPYF